MENTTLYASSGCQQTLIPGERKTKWAFSFPSKSQTLKEGREKKQQSIKLFIAI